MTAPVGNLSNIETFVPLKPADQWPAPPSRDRPRTKRERCDDTTWSGCFPGVDWDFSQTIRDNVGALSGSGGMPSDFCWTWHNSKSWR